MVDRKHDLLAVCERIVRIGPRAAILEDELALGCIPVAPGSVAWLPAYDWPGDVVVSVKGRDVRIALIHARTPGQGAFRRLVDAIAETGLPPVVIEPSMMME